MMMAWIRDMAAAASFLLFIGGAFAAAEIVQAIAGI